MVALVALAALLTLPVTPAAGQSGAAESTIMELSLEPAGGGRFTFRAVVRNSGGVPIQVDGRATIATEDGAELAEFTVEGGTLEPGAETVLAIGEWQTPEGFTGRVLATLRLADPNTRASQTMELAGDDARPAEAAPGSGAPPARDAAPEGGSLEEAAPTDDGGGRTASPDADGGGADDVAESEELTEAASSDGDGDGDGGGSGSAVVVLAVLLLLAVGGGLAVALRTGRLTV